MSRVALTLFCVSQYARSAANHDAVSLLQTTARKLQRPSLHLVHEAERRVPSLQESDQRTACADCVPMCRWLKLSSKTVPAKQGVIDKLREVGASSCPLLEMQLRSAGWIAPEKRTKTDFAESVDCAVDIVRSNVKPDEVDVYVSRLTMCVRSLSTETLSKYQVAIRLLKSELADFEQERKTLAVVARLRQEFWGVCNRSKDALKTHENKAQVIKELQMTLKDAEKLHGHFLVQEIKTARQYLEKLSPIPVVEAALNLAMQDAKHATTPKHIGKSKPRELGELWPLIVRLNISVRDAEELQLPDQVPEAKKVLADLVSFRNKMHKFRRDMQIANISYGTKHGMREARDNLQRSLPWAEAVGLRSGLPRAETLIVELNSSLEALRQLQQATSHGDSVIHEKRLKMEDLDPSIKSLNNTLDAATKANIGGHNVFLRAVATLDMLEYIDAAKKALEASEFWGKAVLGGNQSDLDDARQQAGIQKLLPTIRWAREVGIKQGLAAAQHVVNKLQLVSEAKGNMTEALAVGRASQDAKFGEEDAIKDLTEALARNKAAKSTAGDADAKELLALLERRQRAKDRLTKASDVARIALETGDNLEEASTELRELLKRLNAVGLDQQASIAESLLQALQQAFQSQQELKNSTLRRSSVTHGGGSYGNVSGSMNHSADDADLKGMFAFSRSGYKPVHLPTVNGSEDDGDADFQEHIAALVKAIAAQHARAVIDPEDEVLLEIFRRKELAYSGLKAATRSGQAAFDGAQKLLNTHGIEEAMEKVMEAISTARQYEVKVGFLEAQLVLSRLKRVEPAMDELSAAMLQANISYAAESHMGEALSRLHSATEECKELGLTDRMDEAETLYAVLAKLKGIHVGLKAATMQGEHALALEQGEQTARLALEAALRAAKEVHLSREVPIAQDLLQELEQMTEEQEDLAAAVDPTSARTPVRKTVQKVTRSVSSASVSKKTVRSSEPAERVNHTDNRTEDDSSDEPHSMAEEEEISAAKRAKR